jgi:hypothetical protein
MSNESASKEKNDGAVPPERERAGTVPRRANSGSRSKGGARAKGARTGPGPIGLTRIGGNDFELVHPRAVRETELDYEEGIELWKAGDPESARDALRYALSACHENIWAHVALGRIALKEFRDPGLARGHFGYAFELAERALPPGFKGRLPRERPNNRPFFEAIDGLAQCLDALGRPGEGVSLRALGTRLASGVF